jgi:hypothetical protein
LAEIQALAHLENIDLKVLSYSLSVCVLIVIASCSDDLSLLIVWYLYLQKKLRKGFFVAPSLPKPSMNSGVKDRLMKKLMKTFEGLLSIYGQTIKTPLSSF